MLDRPRKTVEYHVYTGVGKIVAKLNGDVFTEVEVWKCGNDRSTSPAQSRA